MKKRALSLFIAIAIILPVVILAGSVFFAQKSESLGGWKNQNTAFDEANRYIVKLKPDADSEKILDGIEHRSISETDELLFNVIANPEFFKTNSDVIEYFEPDTVRTTLAVTNDPIKVTSYEKLSVYSAWDKTVGAKDVIVAVLDTGIDRTHEDLKNASILPGYDAVTKTAGINEDFAGHGTEVIGLIAATANNEVGIAGVANGVTILPVRVSESGTDIFSSDLIAGIRFAADSGAKIINMSLGGYASSFAEQEAVNYAVSKGCILIAAAGNGGELPYADQKCYPASYDGVVSVASCDKNGKKSSFSQHNDAVDVAIYGEDIPLLYVEDGVSKYRTDSGTSYSAAILSGIAALAVSNVGSSVRFETDEFISLLIETCGKKRTNALGHGIANAEKMISRAEFPLISGVTDGGVYPDSVKIKFNRGSATLDGERIEDGESVIANGSHVLTVTDGEFSQTVRFNLNYAPLYFEYVELSTHSYFEFERGTALLDGFPYKSKDKISSTGKHNFVLFDGNERREKEIYVRYRLPTVYGISDGGKYDEPVYIRIVGDGRAELDGKAVYGEVAVSEKGKHVLEIFSGNDAVSKKINFEITFPNSYSFDVDYGNVTAAFDEENGFYCVYNDSLVGVAVYDLKKPERAVHFLRIGRVYGHLLHDDELLLFGDEGIISIDRKNALDPEKAVKSTFAYDGASLYASADGEIFIFAEDNMLKLNPETGEAETILELGFSPEKAVFENGLFCLTSPSKDNILRILDIKTLSVLEFDIGIPLDGKKICAGDGYFSVGNRVYSIENGNLLLEAASSTGVMLKDGLFFTENRIIEIQTAKETGAFPFDVASISFLNDSVRIFGTDPISANVSNGATGVAKYGAARKFEFSLSRAETENDFRTNIYYSAHSPVISSASSGDSVFVLFENSNTLNSFSTSEFTENDAVSLFFKPKQVLASGGNIIVLFENASFVYVASDSDAKNGSYIPVPYICDSAVVFGNKLYFVSRGKIFSCNLNGGTVTDTTLRAKKIATDGKFIYACTGNALFAYDRALAEVKRITAEGENLTSNGALALGKNVYNLEALELIASFDSDIITLKDNTIVTENGIFNLKTKNLVGEVGVTDTESVTITDSNAVVAFGKAVVAVSYGENGREVVSEPEIKGISEGSTHLGSTVITYENGKGFLDGKAFSSGSTVLTLGDHEFILALPCGRSEVVHFSVKSKLTGIEFIHSSRVVAIGESITLGVRYLPENSPAVPITLKCDSDGIILGENGRLKALRDGRYTVTAEAVTEYGTFKAECTVTVVNTLLSPKEGSGLSIDRDRGFIFGVAPDTTANQLRNLFDNSHEIQIVDRDGSFKNGFAGTGTRVQLLKNGVVSDEMIVVIVGDIDGDGFINAFDIYSVERILRGATSSPEAIAASDVDKNGSLGNNDYRILKTMLIGNGDVKLGEPSLNLFTYAYAQTVSKVKNGDFIDVVICLESCKNLKALSGTLEYGDGLDFVSAEMMGWKSEVQKNGNKLSFYAYDNDGEGCKTAFTAVLNLKFRVTANEKESVKLSSDGFYAVFNDRYQKIVFKPADVLISNPTYDGFNIEFFNAYAFEFDPDVHHYRTTVPHNSAIADILVSCPTDESFTINSTTIPDGNTVAVQVTYTDKNGKESIYTIQVKRDKEPRFDSNCHLSALEVEGFRLTPAFNHNILNYSISVPFGTEKINVYAVPENKTAKVIIGDTAITGTETLIPISVGAPDGETLVYTIAVTLLPEENDPSEDGLMKANLVATVLILVAVALMIASVILLTYVTERKNKK